MGKLGGLMKHPAVLVGGLVIGLLILLAVSRSKSSGGSASADLTAASMATTASSNVQLAGYTTDYNKAALSFQLGLAQVAAENHTTDVGASTALALQALNTVNNIAQAAGDVATMREASAGTINLAHENNEAMLAYATIQAKTFLQTGTVQADLARYLTDSNNAAQVRISEMGFSSANTIADMNATTSRQASENDVRKTKVNAISNIFGGIF